MLGETTVVRKETPQQRYSRSVGNIPNIKEKGLGRKSMECTKMEGLESKKSSQNNAVSAIYPQLISEIKVDVKILEIKREWNLNEMGMKTKFSLEMHFF